YPYPDFRKTTKSEKNIDRKQLEPLKKLTFESPEALETGNYRNIPRGRRTENRNGRFRGRSQIITLRRDPARPQKIPLRRQRRDPDCPMRMLSASNSGFRLTRPRRKTSRKEPEPRT